MYVSYGIRTLYVGRDQRSERWRCSRSYLYHCYKIRNNFNNRSVIVAVK